MCNFQNYKVDGAKSGKYLRNKMNETKNLKFILVAIKKELHSRNLSNIYIRGFTKFGIKVA